MGFWGVGLRAPGSRFRARGVGSRVWSFVFGCLGCSIFRFWTQSVRLQVSSGLRSHCPGAGALGWSLGFMIGFTVYSIGDSTGCLGFGAWVLGSEVVLAFKIESNLLGLPEVEARFLNQGLLGSSVLMVWEPGRVWGVRLGI